MIRFVKSNKDLSILILLSLLSPLFFYKLGQSSLVSWDEAWYADVSRHISQTGDLFNLVFNNMTFTDKPPGGFWIEAMFFKLFGISEFIARLPQAIAGLITLYIIYLLGSKLFNRTVGFCSAISLSSSFWFLSRARSGNLDTLLTLFFVLTTYLAVLASVKKKFFLPFAFSLAFLAMIKGIIFIPVLIPVLIVIFWKNEQVLGPANNLYKIKDFLLPAIITLGLFGVWILMVYVREPSQAFWHFNHSVRESTVENNLVDSLRLFKEYLHNGIGKWFWPGILGVILGIFFKEKRFLILALFFILYSIQFLFSEKLQMWHLIPLYPFMILLFYGSIWVIGEKILRAKTLRFAVGILLLVFAVYFSFLQIKAVWFQFIDIPAFVSDEAILSKEAGKLSGQILLDGDFDPAGTFYAGRPVTKLYNNDLKYLFATKNDFLLITNTWRLENEQVDKNIYKILKKDRDKVLVIKKVYQIND